MVRTGYLRTFTILVAMVAALVAVQAAYGSSEALAIDDGVCLDCSGTPPETHITSGPPTYTNETTAVFVFSSSVGNALFNCRLDGGAWESGCSSPKTYTDLSEGWHSFQVFSYYFYDCNPSCRVAVDLSPSTWWWKVDTTAPTVGSVSPADAEPGVALNTNAEAILSEDIDSSSVSDETFTLAKQGSSSSVAAHVSYDSANKKATLDPDSELEAETTYTATLTTGVKDLAGNVLGQEYSWTFTTTDDATAPSTTAALSPQPNAAGWNKENVTLTLSATDDDSGVKELTYAATGAQPIAERTVQGSLATLPTIITEGETTVTYHATDNAGNAEAEQAFKVKLDKSAPTSSATAKDGSGNSYTSGTLTSKDVTVELSAADGSSGSGVKEITYSINGGANNTYDSTEKIVVSSEGESTISYFATDKAGNQESPAKTFTVKLDKSTPKVDTDNSDGGDSVTPDNGATKVLRTTDVTATFDEPMDKDTVKITLARVNKNGSTTPIGGAQVTYDEATRTVKLDPYGSAKTKLAKGATYKVTVEGTDLAGNSIAPTSWSFTTGRK